MTQDAEQAMYEYMRKRRTTNLLVELLQQLIDENRLIATVDVDGMPFHFATTVTPSTRFDGTVILWLSPAGYDDDLATVMVNYESDVEDAA